MTKLRSLRRKLNEEAERLTVIAAEQAVSGGDCEQEIKRIENCEKLRDKLPRWGGPATGLAFFIVTVCLAAASLAWVVHMPTATVHVEAQVSALDVQLSAPYEWDGAWSLGGAGTQLIGFATMRLPPELGTLQMLAQSTNIDIEGGAVELTSLKFAQGARVRILKGAAGNFNMLTWGKPVEGELQVAGSPTFMVGASSEVSVLKTTTTFDPPGVVDFQDPGHPAIPAVLQATPAGVLTLKHVSVQAITLFTEVTDRNQEQHFESTINNAEITVLDSDESRKLKAGDPLYVEVVRGSISELKIGNDGISFAFDGRVSRIAVGPQDYQRDLSPTLLEYVYHQKRLALFWSAVTFLWGLLWGGRKIFF